MRPRPAWRLALWGLSAWLLASFFALKYGAVPDASIELIAQLRFPRVLLATALGMGLAVAGASLQALFANPLCEPYTLGLSSGAGLGAVIGITLKLDWNFLGLAGPAFLGAVAFSLVLFMLSHAAGATVFSVLLGGVVLGFFGSSLITLWMAMSDTNGIQSAIFWLLGDLSRARLSGALVALTSVFGLTLLLWSRWRELDAHLLGEEDAKSVGIDVVRSRKVLIFLVSMMVAICVSSAGMIGFVGLVIPHFVRRFAGALHYRLIPLAAIWGAASLTFSDGLSRVVTSPFEVPVGVVTALMGAPLFLLILLKRRVQHGE